MRNHYFLLTNVFSKSWQSILSVLILCAFLCATISHSAHSELIQDNIELQQCKLCQHSIDTPTDSLSVKRVSANAYYVAIQAPLTQQSQASLYFIPQLRAPPSQ